ncbi:MAG: hypothetical protein EON48_06370 [Acetobacteraceae bacterium]|nr:MAG: hypothetical protein EON48_06370 [Acetobacteraceae bacterium]
MSALTAREPWPVRIEKGQGAETQVIAIFQAAGWSALPSGLAREDAPVPSLETPEGEVRPCDFVAYPPGGRQSYVVEVKQKFELTRLGGYGLDASKDDAKDCWVQLQLHDKYAGPVLLVIVDPDKNRVICATVRMLSRRSPLLSRSGTTWYWSLDTFVPLQLFLEI